MSFTYQFKTRRDEALNNLEVPKAGVWIHTVRLTAGDIVVLVEKHGLDEGLLKDAQDFFEAPRLEQEEGVTYFFTRYPARIDGEMTTAPILIAVGPDFVLTAVQEKPQWLARLEGQKDVVTTQKAKLFLQILRAIEREYTRVFNDMRREVRRARITVGDVTERAIEESVQLEYALIEFVSALVPANSALRQVITGKYLTLYEDDLELVEDVQLSNGQLIESAKNALKTIQNIRSAHATLVSNRLNKVVRILTALTILLTIPTIVGTLYGMNVPLPFQDSQYMFPGIIVFVAIAVAGASYLFVRNKWL